MIFSCQLYLEMTGFYSASPEWEFCVILTNINIVDCCSHILETHTHTHLCVYIYMFVGAHIYNIYWSLSFWRLYLCACCYLISCFTYKSEQPTNQNKLILLSFLMVRNTCTYIDHWVFYTALLGHLLLCYLVIYPKIGPNPFHSILFNSMQYMHTVVLNQWSHRFPYTQRIRGCTGGAIWSALNPNRVDEF